MVLADTLLLPEDDLALATVLRSPLFGFTDEELFAIAWNRGGSSLRTALMRKAAERQIRCRRRADRKKLAQDARHKTPFAFYAEFSAPAARGGDFWRGSAWKPMTHSTNSSILRSTTSGARLRRCKVFWPGCGERARRGQARHGDRARRGTRDDRARRQGSRSADRHSRRHHDAARPGRGIRGCCASGGAMVWAGRKDDDVAAVASRPAAASAKRSTNIAGSSMSP